jgi:hypothetical protein
MQTATDEIAPDVFRISTFVPEVGPAKEAEAVFKATCLTPTTGATIRSLADLQPTVLGVMHGSSYNGNCASALRDLASVYGEMHAAAE